MEVDQRDVEIRVKSFSGKRQAFYIISVKICFWRANMEF